MEREYAEEEILQDALERLQKITKLNVQAQHANYGPDAVMRITLNGKEWHFVVEVKRNLTRATLGLAIHQTNKFQEKGLIVAGYVTPQMADLMKEMDIQFVDAAGNAYINEPPLFIFIKGNKLAGKYRKERQKRAFRPAGLQVVFALLCNPGLENAPFREIANVANVALGTVGWVITDLTEMRYLIDMGKRGRRLVEKRKLLERWVTAYPDQLRPKQLIGRYKAMNYDWWKDTELKTFGAYWGGEIGGTKLTKYLKPQNATIYITQPVGKLLLKNRIKKDPAGNIEILKAFWNFECEWAERDSVHPVLVYADLLTTGDARNIETADMIYEQEINGLIREA